MAGRPYGLSSWVPPTVAPICLVGLFDTHIECATRTQEQLAQVRRLTTTGQPGPPPPGLDYLVLNVPVASHSGGPLPLLLSRQYGERRRGSSSF